MLCGMMTVGFIFLDLPRGESLDSSAVGIQLVVPSLTLKVKAKGSK
jgi:hypothetical protein